MKKKKAEVLLKKSGADKKSKEEGIKFHEAAENARVWIWEINAKGQYIYSNPVIEDILGYKPDELQGKYFYDLFHPEDRDEQKKLAFRVFARKRAFRGFVNRNIHKDGRVVWFSTSGVPVLDKKGKLIGYRGTIIDITQNKESEAALRESERRFKLLSRATNDVVWDWDLLTGKVWWNDAVRIRFGYPKDEIISNIQWREAKIHPQDRKRVISGIHKVIERGGFVWSDEYRFCCRDNSYAVIFDRAFIIHNNSGKATRMIGSMMDITGLKQAEKAIKQSFAKLQRVFEETVQAMTEIIETRDPYTAGHQRRVSNLACAIAREMGVSRDEINGIRLAGILHDIGKIYVPSDILSKPGKLNSVEFEIIRTHPQRGYDILKMIEFPWPVAEMVLQHHERINGSGYPLGLSDGKILMGAKILGVADVVEAMAFRRPYRVALGINEALSEISKNKKVLYDPRVVDTCVTLFTDKDFNLDRKIESNNNNNNGNGG